VKRNPLLHRDNDEGRETRRKLFLKRVRDSGEEKRWEARGGEDEMMRCIWAAEEKRWMEKKAREAGMVSSQEVEEEDDTDERGVSRMARRNDTTSMDDDMLDEVAAMEDREIEAMLAAMEAEHQQNTGMNERQDMLYGSDGDEYDHLFMDVIQQERSQQPQTSHPLEPEREDHDHDMMDMS
jgi:hypothetical protein